MNDFAHAWIAALACLAFLHLTPADPRQVDPPRLFYRLEDAGEYGINGLFGRAFLKASLVRHIINQVHQFHAARSPEGGGERAWDEASVIRFVQMSPSRMRGALLQPA